LVTIFSAFLACVRSSGISAGLTFFESTHDCSVGTSFYTAYSPFKFLRFQRLSEGFKTLSPVFDLRQIERKKINVSDRPVASVADTDADTKISFSILFCHRQNLFSIKLPVNNLSLMLNYLIRSTETLPNHLHRRQLDIIDERIRKSLQVCEVMPMSIARDSSW